MHTVGLQTVRRYYKILVQVSAPWHRQQGVSKTKEYTHQHIYLGSTMRPTPQMYWCLYSFVFSRSQWPRGLRRRSTAARLLRLWVRIPPGAWMFVCRECCVLSGRGLCDGLITRPEESYRLLCVVCDLEIS